MSGLEKLDREHQLSILYEKLGKKIVCFYKNADNASPFEALDYNFHGDGTSNLDKTVSSIRALIDKIIEKDRKITKIDLYK